MNHYSDEEDWELPRICTAEDVARFFRVSTETIRRMDRAGEIVSIKGLRVKRYNRRVVLEMVHRQAPNA